MSFSPKGRGEKKENPAPKLIIYEQLALHTFFLSTHQATESSNYVSGFSLLVYINRIIKIY